MSANGRLPNAKRTASKRDTRLDAEALPPGWQKEAILLNEQQYRHFGGDGQMFAGKDAGIQLQVFTYQQYTLPPETKVEDRMCFEFFGVPIVVDDSPHYCFLKTAPSNCSSDEPFLS